MSSKGASGISRGVSPRDLHGNSIHQTPSSGGKDKSINKNKISKKVSKPLFSPLDIDKGSTPNDISGVVSPPDIQGNEGKNGVHSHRREEGQQQQNKNKVTNPNKTKKKTSNQKVGIIIPPKPPPSDGIAQLQWQGNFKGNEEESMFGMWSDKEKPSGWGEATYVPLMLLLVQQTIVVVLVVVVGILEDLVV